MAKIKAYVPDRLIFDFAEKQFGIHIDEDELVIDDDAIAAAVAVALGRPKGYPPMLEDPVERKKVFIDHIKRMHGSFLAAFTHARENASISSSSEAVHNIPSSTVMAEPGSDGLIKTGTLPRTRLLFSISSCLVQVLT